MFAVVAVAAQAPPLPEASGLLRVSFISLTLVVATLWVSGVYWSALRAGIARDAARTQAVTATGAAALWLAVTGALAASGVLRFASPPTMLPVFPAVIATAIVIALSPVGGRLAMSLPLAALIGFQSFRIAVELLLHRAYTEGLMPVQMSYSGRNLDIVTGITAVAVALWLGRGRRSSRVVFAWNTVGVLLLLNILIVALLSAPTPMRVFMNEPANIWVTRAPWVWLPTVLVLAAVMGHALVYRRLWLERTVSARRASSGAAAATGFDEPLRLSEIVAHTALEQRRDDRVDVSQRVHG